MSNFNSNTYINSDCSLIIEFNNESSLELTQFILGVQENIKQNGSDKIIETVPAYNSLLVIYQPQNFQPQQEIDLIDRLIETSEPVNHKHSQHHIIPVCYDEQFAIDLKQVAKHCNLSIAEVIKRHTENHYYVYMLGFLPGFLYLGGLNTQLHCPRRSEPRPRIEAGAVAIGGNQTGIYPIDSPGGWNIIGKTPQPMLTTDSEVPAIAKPLDTIQFKPISLEEFLSYGD